jgi:hypothetical protein
VKEGTDVPINPIVLQRRHSELGRIRLGVKTPTSTGKTRPEKLDRYRFTSPHERHIRDLATLYGGAPRQWQNGTRTEWEVITDATTIPVIVVKGGISQWFETWSGGGCQRRCDGVREQLTDSPCICDGEDRERTCKPTTRLSVMLRDLDAIGVWRLESHGWNAAAELPGLVELAQYVSDLVPARLILSERIAIKDGKTSRFVVPGLDLEVAPARLAALVTAQSDRAVESAPEAKAIEHQAPEAPDYLRMVADATTEDELQALWTQARESGGASRELSQAVTDRLDALRGTQERQDASSTADMDELWDACVREAGRLGWSTSHLNGEFEDYHAIPVRDADPGQMSQFLAHLKSQAVAS